MNPDFLVIGAGVAGLRAAIELAEAGSVLVEDSVENILRNPLVRDIYLGKQAAA